MIVASTAVPSLTTSPCACRCVFTMSNSSLAKPASCRRLRNSAIVAWSMAGSSMPRPRNLRNDKRSRIASSIAGSLSPNQRCISVILSMTITGTLGRPPLAEVLRYNGLTTAASCSQGVAASSRPSRPAVRGPPKSASIPSANVSPLLLSFHVTLLARNGPECKGVYRRAQLAPRGEKGISTYNWLHDGGFNPETLSSCLNCLAFCLSFAASRLCVWALPCCFPPRPPRLCGE